MDPGCSGALRVDAARNRAAVVVAARHVFGERGLDAPLDEIARRAGVGNATLYRRFPTRAALIEAVFTDRMAEYGRAVDEALADPDPWNGFRGYVLRILRLQADDRGLADLLVTTTGTDDAEIERIRNQGLVGVVALIDRAKACGALRPDFTHQDVVLLLMANAGLVHRTADAAPGSWERMAAFVLDGLQAGAATPAPPAPPVSEVRAAMDGRRCTQLPNPC